MLATRLRTMREAGMLGGGTLQGGIRLARNVLLRDFHPSTLWGLHAANLPDKLALVEGERLLTWRELDARINRLAQGLLSIGIRPGDRVAYMLRNSIEWIESLAACSKIGAAAVFVSYRYTPPEIEYLVSNSEAALLVFGADYREVVAQAKERLGLPDRAFLEVGGAPGSPFPSYDELIHRSSEEEPPRELRSRGGSRVILYTSGTTGRPKGAVRDLSRAGLGSLLDFLQAVPFRRSDRHLVAAPLYHATGSGFATIHVSLGATLYLLDPFHPLEFLKLVDREKITTSALVPTMLRAILMLPEEERKRYDVSSLRVIVCTGSALPQNLKEAARSYLGPVLYDLYGATEMGWVTVATPDDQIRKPGSVGRPVPGTDVVLLSEERVPVADGEVGELFARNPVTIEGYHGNEEATRKSRWEGYFSVGDLAVRDADGYITLVDRKTDMVISGGMNIYPAEIETVLVAHPKIFEAAVIGVPDEHWGESLVALIVPRPGQTITDEEVIAHCRQSLAGYKIPRRIERVPELPRNPTGKVLKKELRHRLEKGTDLFSQ
ncbi:MAG: class I adenylate-forming enzyme family protein [Candidatus Binatia bacterium]